MHKHPRKVAVREFAGFHGRRSHSGAAGGRDEGGAKSLSCSTGRAGWIRRTRQGPRRESVKEACRKQRWQHRAEDEPGNTWPSKTGGHARGRWWKTPDLWPRRFLRGKRREAGSRHGRHERGNLIQDLGTAIGRRRVSGDSDEMGLDRLSRDMVPHRSDLEPAGLSGSVTPRRAAHVGGPEAADVVAGRVH